MSKIPKFLGIFVVIVAMLFAGWLFLALLGWAAGSPEANLGRCRAIAKSQGIEWATTGWRNDTCYLYKDGREEIIKL